ncbi:hypothetical protein [Phocaeicola sp.]
MIGKLIRSVIYHFNCVLRSFFWLLLQMRRGCFRNFYSKEIKKSKAIVLATGPSLKAALEMGIDDLSSSDICVVNEFCKHPKFEELKPVMYILADPLYFVEEWMGDSDRQTIEILSNVTWNMTVYVPYIYYKGIRGKLDSQYVKVCPYNSIPYNGWHNIKLYLYKKGLSMPAAQNVLIPSIFNAINSGYKEIDLYGVDHSWTKEIRVNDKNQVCLCDTHFYDQKKPNLLPWKRCEGEVYKMHEILRDLALMFEGYYQLREYADVKGCRIVNKTSDSFIDAFERG